MVEIGVPRGAPAPRARRPDLRARARRSCPHRARDGHEVQLRAWWWSAGGSSGLTGAPTMAALAAAAHRRRLRAGGGARAGAAGAGAAAARADDAAACPTRTARTRPTGSSEVAAAGRAGRRGRARARASAARDGARRSSRARWRGAVQTPLLIDADGLNAHAGGSSSLRGRDGSDRAHPARRRARPPARHRLRRGGRAPAGTARARPPSAAARWCC